MSGLPQVYAGGRGGGGGDLHLFTPCRNKVPTFQ